MPLCVPVHTRIHKLKLDAPKMTTITNKTHPQNADTVTMESYDPGEENIVMCAHSIYRHLYIDKCKFMWIFAIVNLSPEWFQNTIFQ